MSDHDDIRTLLKRYETSLNTSDADLAAGCYTADGVFMPTTLPTAIGPSMRDAYADLFTAISLDVEFTIDELVVDSDELAYALTRSTGTQTVLSTGSAGTESNRELFLLRKETGSWKWTFAL
jgi:uncharacterized protein (TIGR02246 family)